MKIINIAVATALFLGVTALYASAALGENPPPKPHVTPTSSVVQLRVNEAGCTAFYIGNDEFLSAGHCTAETGEFTFDATGDNGESFKVNAGAVFDTNAGPFPDFELLVAGAPVDKNWTPAFLNCDYTPVLGDDVQSVGFPAGVGDGPILTRGYVAGMPRLVYPYSGGWAVPQILVDMPVFGGHSGSPVYHDNKVVGILVGSNQQQKAWSVVQPLGTVCKILEAINGTDTPQTTTP